MLLVPDTADVCRQYGGCELDGGAGNSDGRGEEFPVGTPPERPHRDGFAGRLRRVCRSRPSSLTRN